MPASSGIAVSAPLAIPHTQNTAPVLEFRCLFTSDLRRKQKRWQDGWLKFHTHNKRVMVYDERANYVGDTHWREEHLLAEGEELQLERGGILVEVSECIGKTDQDLTELVDKRVKEKEERAAALAQRGTPLRGSSTIQRFGGTPGPHQPLKSLSALLTPSGHHGRAAIPMTSPFDERKMLAGDSIGGKENERPAKRQRLNDVVQSKSGYAQNLTGATLSLSSSRPPTTAPIRYEPLRPTFTPKPPPIDLTVDEDSENDKVAGRSALNSSALGKTKSKTRRSPPSKSGYANNLTGATLSLSAVNTRIAPPKPKPNKSIDLNSSSSEEEAPRNQSGSSKSKPNRRLAQALETSGGKREQIRKLEKHLSSSSATNSEVSTDEEDVPQESKKPVLPAIKRQMKSSFLSKNNHEQAKQKNQLQVHNVSGKSRLPFAVSDEESDQDANEIIPQSQPITKEKASIQDRLSTKVRAAVHRSSSLERTSKKAASRTDIVSQSVSVDEPEPRPQRTMSSLRIISRPPRKMMMLMERPCSNSPTVSKSKDVTATGPSKRRAKVSTKATDVILSQATVQLDAFHQKQEQRLEAPLNGKRRSRNSEILPDSGDEEMSAKGGRSESDQDVEESDGLQANESHEPNSSAHQSDEMDHTTIDNILSRKNSLASTASVTSHHSTTNPNLNQDTMSKQTSNPTAKLHQSPDTPCLSTPQPQKPTRNPRKQSLDATSNARNPPSRKDGNERKRDDSPSSPTFEQIPGSRYQNGSSAAASESNIASSRPQSNPTKQIEAPGDAKPWLTKKVPDLTKDSPRPVDNDARNEDGNSPETERDEASRLDGKNAKDDSVVEGARDKGMDEQQEGLGQDESGKDDVEEVQHGDELRNAVKGSENQEKVVDEVNTMTVDARHHMRDEEALGHITSDDGSQGDNEETSHHEDDGKDGILASLGGASTSPLDNHVPIILPEEEEQQGDLRINPSQPQSSPAFPISPPLHAEQQNARNNQIMNGGIQSATAQFRTILSSVQNTEGSSTVRKSEESKNKLVESRKTVPEKNEEEDPLLSSDKVMGALLENIKMSPGSRLMQSDTLHDGPGQGTMELAEEVTSTIELADIPSAPSSITQPAVLGRILVSNPATTRSGRSLSELAASTRDAPSLESSFPLSLTNKAPLGILLSDQRQNKVVANSCNPLQNLNETLHTVTRGSDITSRGGSALQNLPTFESRIAKRIYPAAPKSTVGRDKVLHSHEQQDGRENIPCGHHVHGLMLGGATRHQQCLDTITELGDGRSDYAADNRAEARDAATVRRACEKDVGIGVVAGPWSREAFDIFGAWFRPRPGL